MSSAIDAIRSDTKALQVLPPDACRRCNGTGKRQRLHPDNVDVMLCHDCRDHYASYMVTDVVWRSAWPTYSQEKAELRRIYGNTSESFRAQLNLCFKCLETRLGRQLVIEDFRLELPINAGILLGIGLKPRG